MRTLLTISSFTFVLACGSPAPESTPESTPSTVNANQPPEAHKASCTCGEGKKGGTVWCDKCQMGFIDGVNNNDKAAVDAALASAAHEGHAHEGHAHEGHAHDGAACTCGEGKKGGTVWCDKCDKGFVDGVATDDKAAVDAAIANN